MMQTAVATAADLIADAAGVLLIADLEEAEGAAVASAEADDGITSPFSLNLSF